MVGAIGLGIVSATPSWLPTLTSLLISSGGPQGCGGELVGIEQSIWRDNLSANHTMGLDLGN